jgi:hypothetical protein
MVSLADVKRWNPGQLDEIVHTVQQQLQILIHSGDDYGKVIPVEGWSGPAAGNADSAHRSLMSRVEKMAAGMSIISKSIGQASDAILGVQHAITNAEELARKYGYQVADNGAVADTFPEGKAPPEMNPDYRARVRTEVADAIAQALRTADDIDNDLTSVLKRAETGDFGTGDESTVAAAADGAKDPGLTLLDPPRTARPHRTPDGGTRSRQRVRPSSCAITRTGWATSTASPARPAPLPTSRGYRANGPTWNASVPPHRQWSTKPRACTTRQATP